MMIKNLDTVYRVQYVIKIGRFGCYYYDQENKKDIDLEEALDMMNELSKRKKNLREGRRKE